LKKHRRFKPLEEVVEEHFLALTDRNAAFGEADQGQYRLAKLA
jgi:hypothetical protein